MIELKGCRFVDLTHELYHGMPGWPTHPLLRVDQLKVLNIDGYNVKELVINTHHGTHVDAPAHMIEGGKTLDQYPIEKFMHEGIAIRLDKGEGEAIGEADLKSFDIREGDFVLLYTGMSNYRGFNKKYLYLWPYLAPDGARYLAARKINAVGIDGLSIGAWGGTTAAAGPVSKTAVETHEILLSNDILILEEVANLDVLLGGADSKRSFFIMLPLRIKDSDGSPVRLVAVNC